MKYTKGELIIKKYLEKKRIKYKSQYKLIINSRVHIFDFAIVDKYGVKGFIEYDGEQHYKPISIFGGEEGYKNRVERDNEKNEFCKINGILLIRVPYSEKKVGMLLDLYLKDLNKKPSFEIIEYKCKLPFEKKGKTQKKGKKKTNIIELYGKKVYRKIKRVIKKVC